MQRRPSALHRAWPKHLLLKVLLQEVKCGGLLLRVQTTRNRCLKVTSKLWQQVWNLPCHLSRRDSPPKKLSHPSQTHQETHSSAGYYLRRILTHKWLQTTCQTLSQLKLRKMPSLQLTRPMLVQGMQRLQAMNIQKWALSSSPLLWTSTKIVSLRMESRMRRQSLSWTMSISMHSRCLSDTS